MTHLTVPCYAIHIRCLTLKALLFFFIHSLVSSFCFSFNSIHSITYTFLASIIALCSHIIYIYEYIWRNRDTNCGIEKQNFIHLKFCVFITCTLFYDNNNNNAVAPHGCAMWLTNHRYVFKWSIYHLMAHGCIPCVAWAIQQIFVQL